MFFSKWKAFGVLNFLFASKWFVWCNFGKSYGHLLMFVSGLDPGWYRIPRILVFHGLWRMLHQFNFDHFGLTSVTTSMAKVMICTLIVLGCSRCDQEITLQSLLSPRYAEDLPPQMDFSGYVRSWIVLKKKFVSQFVHFCLGNSVYVSYFYSLYAYLPKQPTNIGHIYYCQVHFWVVSTKKPCTIITAGPWNIFTYIHT